MTNAGGTVNLLEAARAAGTARFVNISTGGAMYGQVDMRPTPEDHPIAPDAPYGVSKRAAEEYCGLFGRLHGLSTVSLRLGNVYGPRQHPLSEAGVIAIFCGCAVRGDAPDDLRRRAPDPRLRLRGGHRGRHARAAAPDVTGPVNVGSGVESSLLDVVAAIAPHAEPGFDPRPRARAPGRDPQQLARILAGARGARLDRDRSVSRTGSA